MNQLLTNLASFKSNPHVTIPALLLGACKIAKIWLPKYSAQLEATEAVLAVYTLKAAANSPAAPTANTLSPTPSNVAQLNQTKTP